jgi:hypothetical protein
MRDAVDLAVVLKIRDGADSREAPRAIRRIQRSEQPHDRQVERRRNWHRIPGPAGIHRRAAAEHVPDEREELSACAVALDPGPHAERASRAERSGAGDKAP